MRTKLIAVVGAIAIAFLLATNPVVVDAAGKIGSNQIKNNAIKSKHIKNNNVTSADIKNGQIKLTDLHASTKKVLGVRTKAYSATVSLPSTTGFSMDLPTTAAGTYLVTFNVWLYGTTGIYCGVTHPGFVGPMITSNYADSPSNFRPLSASGVFVHDGTPLHVICQADGASTWSSYSQSPLQVSLTKIDTGTVTPGTASRHGSASRGPSTTH